ncbi:aldehyde dehydrogenase [Aulographum hederae CBS 113979]|uniref:aldehyde dehydrogenase (NAD(+)) n=1 Tax=Aulographum hederae CBS 113979 TaxID=1176131 RepID=A0A6G1HEC4_9PEZI|nr:aldehyde dehydrogenase [Aulographum hederae CBS 113979]
MDVLEQLEDLSLYITLAVGALTLFLLIKSSLPDPEAAVNYTVPVPEQCRPEWKGEILEEPSIKLPKSSAIQCYCPANGRLLGLVNPATPDGIDRAVSRAQQAQKEWAKTTFSQRRRVLKTLLKFLLENQDTIATASCLDSGKTRVDACFGEILVTAEKLKWTIDHGERPLRPSSRPTNFLMFYKKNEVVYEPLGVVSAAVSWNYPFHNLFGPVISALFSGNAIVLKPSEQTAWSSAYFTSIARGALTACGHNAQLIQTTVCWPSVAPHLTSHPGISHLTFIGSRPVAHLVAASAAKALTPTVIELGGKDAAIILDDIGSDLSRVTQILLRGVFQAAGQNCIGIERIICLPTIYPKIVSELHSRIKSFRSGSILDSATPIDVGASISAANFSTLESLIADAVSRGATLLAGGKRLLHPDHPKGHYFQPTLLIDVTPSMPIAQTELFAPIAVVMKAESVAQAIEIANSTPYALGASVFGKRLADLECVAREVHAGMVAINDFAAYYAVQLPFGGVKGSGYGRFAGEEGLRGLCNMKAICRDRWPGVMKTAIPGPLGLPVKDQRAAEEMGKGVVEVGYGESLGRRFKGVRRMIGM